MKPLLLAALVAPLVSGQAFAQVIVSANDAKVTLVDGVTTVIKNPPPDTVTVIDLGVSPPKVLGEVQAPASVIGPPESVAIAPNQPLALVTSSTKLDPADASKTVPDDRVTLIDIGVSPPAIVGTVRAGSGASGVSFNPSGSLALVANRMEGTISIFAVNGKTLTPAGKVDLGAPQSGPSHVVFTRDGRMALVTRNTDSLISILAVDGSTVTYTKRDLAAGLKPYSIQVSPTADIAIVGNVGAGPAGGADTISVIDLAARPPRAVNHVTVGPTAEGIGISPDGKHVAVTVMNGTNAPKASGFFNPAGRLRIFSLAGTNLTPVAEAPLGQWCQGTAWSRDGRTVVAQCMLQQELQLFRFDGRQLSRTGTIKVNGGPAGIAGR
ncbi:MAG: YncE family protein [Vicinamibacterales bacterium]